MNQGMATSLPPHNPSEIFDAIVAVVDNPEIELLDLHVEILNAFLLANEATSGPLTRVEVGFGVQAIVVPEPSPGVLLALVAVAARFAAGRRRGVRAKP